MGLTIKQQLKQEAKSLLNIDIEHIEYAKNNDIWIATDNFTHILASSTASVADLEVTFNIYKDTVNTAWSFIQQGIASEPTGYNEADAAFAKIEKTLRKTHTKPDVEFIGALESKVPLNMVAFTDTTSALLGKI